MSRSKNAAIYARVSTADQTTENQVRELRDVASRQGWRVVDVYIDQGVSGARGRDKRPEFDRLLTDAMRRKHDVIMSWSVDRLGRSLQHLLGFLEEINAKGIDLYLHQQGIDTTTPAGRAMFQMCGVFAEFERAIIRERIKAGLARVKRTRKTKTGNPVGRPRIAIAKEREIKNLREEGIAILKIAERVGVGSATVQRVLRSATR